MKEAVDNILFSEDDFLKITQGINSLYQLFSKHTKIEAGDLTNSKHLSTESGLAVSIEHAAHCLKDLSRTTRFLRGIHQAIKDQLTINKPVRILYAGCGPYATLLTPLTSQFTSGEVQYTFLDINPESISCAKTLYEKLQLEDYIENTLVADATSELALNDAYDIIISETMAQALKTECQVPLTRKMVQYLKPQGTFIPQRVLVNAYSCNCDNIYDPAKDPKALLGNVYDLNFKNVPPKGHERTIEVAKTENRGLYLYTEIQVYKSEIIQYFESGLTTPFNIRNSISDIERVSFTYLEGNECGYEINYE